MSYSLSRRDRDDIRRRGISVEELERQLDLFADPPRPTRLDRPASRGDGIRRLETDEGVRLESIGRAAQAEGRFLKFVPASGAASRMFASLSGDAPEKEAIELFAAELERLPFGDRVPARLHANPPALVAYVLGAGGLGLAQKPKGLVPFHRYSSGTRTAFAEHLHEAPHYVRADDPARCRAHFTVLPEHRDAFADEADSVGRELAESGIELEVQFSIQSPAGDTVAVDLDNRPLRDASGDLVFRPAGHGALLPNLEATAGDIVFVRNIDNIARESRHANNARWKLRLGGLLVELTTRAGELLDALEAGGEPDALTAAREFLQTELCLELPSDLGNRPPLEQRDFLRDRLGRPYRVCSVVENTGEPGGGPFWVRSGDGSTSGQIVESVQIDHRDPGQEATWSRSTHFNPADLACALRDHRGRPHDLGRHVDPATSFVSRKSSGGRQLKALERPGLWNGSMAGWNTAFVEVPLSTFTPVKTIFDLLRPEHQDG